MTTARKKTTSTAAKPKTKAKPRSRAKKPATSPKKSAAVVEQAPVTEPVVAEETPAAVPVEPTVVEAPQAVIMGPMLRKKELVDTVVMRSGMKKKDVKPVVETLLTVLGEAMRDNRELNLPPFGHLKVRREKPVSNGRIVVAKIRQANPPVAVSGSEMTDDADE